MTIKVDGIVEAEKKLLDLRSKKVAGFTTGLAKAGYFLLSKSQELVPVDTGALKSSAYVKVNGQEIKDSESGIISRTLGIISGWLSKLRRKPVSDSEIASPPIELEVGYTQHYAIYVHENLEANHPNGGEAKFLEKPAREYRGQMKDIVLKEVEKA